MPWGVAEEECSQSLHTEPCLPPCSATPKEADRDLQIRMPPTDLPSWPTVQAGQDGTEDTSLPPCHTALLLDQSGPSTSPILQSIAELTLVVGAKVRCPRGENGRAGPDICLSWGSLVWKLCISPHSSPLTLHTSPLATFSSWESWLQDHESRRVGSAPSLVVALRRACCAPCRGQHSEALALMVKA